MYNRMNAKAYADRWWNGYNPAFPAFPVDCTNFISQCLFAGGAPMNYTNNRNRGWWFDQNLWVARARQRAWTAEPWSYSWAVAHSLYWYLRTSQTGLRGRLVERATDLQIGDVINYDWEGDGRFTHSTMVTGFDASGQPLVNAHTNSSLRRLWSYRDSPAWSPATKYAFFQISVTD